MDNLTYIPDYKLVDYDINKQTVLYRIKRNFNDIKGQYKVTTEKFKNNKPRTVYLISELYVKKLMEENAKTPKALVRKIEERYYELYTLLDVQFFDKKYHKKKSEVANMELIDTIIGHFIVNLEMEGVSLLEKRAMGKAITSFKFTSLHLSNKILAAIEEYIKTLEEECSKV
ncbi:MAG: Unknown protein [uncultured Sulfurovum sp.]|uniref:Uncharacterized protein n=1 Tax=uncultured Sulfurovum sp. TaxID=269237 RepID=A0A6S6SA23_9BACT|nr:MAG: Unknown protein [uncultured Sulfurovum sp.]